MENLGNYGTYTEDSVFREPQVFDLLDKEFRICYLKHFQRIRGNHAEKQKKNRRVISHQTKLQQ